MKLVMTLLVRDEADVVDAQIAFHLHAGVDLVLATDNDSRDGTREILERYARAGVLHLLDEPGDDMRQSQWVTRMARLAATDFGADWVLHADADEFWWPRGGTLKEVLAAVPARFGVVRGCWRHFLPRPDDGGFFAERMTVRLCTPAHPGDKETIFHAHQKVAHRAHPEVVIEAGNHNADAPGLEPLRAWHPIEVLHFSFRSVAQLAGKAERGGWLRNPEYVPPAHQLRLRRAFEEGAIREFYEAHAVDDDALERGLATGRLALDTRLRDALRALRGPDGGFALPGGAPRLSFPRPDYREDAAYAAEASVLVEIDGIVRAERRVDALERRLARLEAAGLRRAVARRLRRLARR
ncbi:MAG TPA: glycosyltransferase family 2 protein [Gaiellaceae bacterium]|nr:glycosyltransferase family 2 protein [Gaiellaceae bacterium]